MKITINTFGTHGDVQPYIALSMGLRDAGHDVRVVTHKIFEAFVDEYGFEVFPLDVDPRQVLISQALSDLGNNTIRIHRWIEENARSAMRDIFTATLAASREADLLLNSGLSFVGWHVAEKLDIPAIGAYLWPSLPSRYLPPTAGAVLPEWLPMRGAFYYLMTKFSNQLFFNLLAPLVSKYRQEILGLDSMKRWEYWTLDSPKNKVPMVFGFSPSVVAKPKDWGDQKRISGYWMLDTSVEYQPEPALLDFLKSGPSPVFIGFGSLVDHEQEAINKIIIDALYQSGQRGIIQGGWSGLGAGDLPEFIFKVGSLSHEWLFPRMAAVVHHGGAGTTAQGLRSGVPSIIVPSFGDQFFWGWRVLKLGVGPEPINRKELTAAKLASSILIAVSDVSIKHKASDLGHQIKAEDGVGAAVNLINAFVRDGHL